ncbi:MAG: hypothetical protein J5574_04405 [Lachnospiraceae bacterium]|nr:hypothetical protein [Lachnospiraceae bacterium]
MRIKGIIRKTLALTLALSTLFALSVSATVADYYDIGFLKFNGVYVNRWGQPIPNVTARGIDVSSYQETIDWAAVATDDVSFAFIRCGTTNSGPDRMFETNAAGAAANGIPFGIYYRTYAPNEEIAKLEAQYTVLSAQKTGATLPLVMDIEGSTLAALGTVQLQKNIQAWCDVVKAAGYTPMVYSSKSFMNTYIKSTPCDKWIAQYGDVFTYTGGGAKYWQCSSHGWVNGIAGRVDIDFRLN